MQVSRRQAIKILSGSAAASLIGGRPAISRAQPPPPPIPTGLLNKTRNGVPIDINDPEWPLYFCNVKEAWTKSKGKGINIWHTDTGYTIHPELIAGDRVLDKRGSSFFPRIFGVQAQRDASDLMDGIHNGHGTHTGALIMSGEGHPSSSGNFPNYTPSKFVSGFAPEAFLIPARVTNTPILEFPRLGYVLEWLAGSGVGAVPSLTAAIRKAAGINMYLMSLMAAIPSDPSSVDDQISVISISLGAFINNPALAAAIGEARKAGIVVIAAAGQDWMDPDSDFFETINHILPVAYPGQYPETISVAACTHQFEKYKIGLYGPEVDVTAPGVLIWKARVRGGQGGSPFEFDIFQDHGTSFSVAFTAGACALWFGYHGRAALLNRYGIKDSAGKIVDATKIGEAFRTSLLSSCDRNPAPWRNPEYVAKPNRGVGVLNVDQLLNTPLPNL